MSDQIRYSDDCLRIFVERPMWGRDLRFVLFGCNGDGTVVTDYTIQKLEDRAIPHTAEKALTPLHAQQLMDQLWACGIRPSSGDGNVGAMAAVQEHLKDLRKLVFDRPIVPSPPPILLGNFSDFDKESFEKEWNLKYGLQPFGTNTVKK